jgi:hypothetical protein
LDNDFNVCFYFELINIFFLLRRAMFICIMV